MRPIVLYVCEAWLKRIADERMLDVFYNDSINAILHARHRGCVPSVELRRRFCLARIPALLVQKRLRWFGHAATRAGSELIKGLLLPTPPRTWRTGSQLKMWVDLEPLSGLRVFGYARWRKRWVKVSKGRSLRNVEPGLPPSVTWTTRLVMLAQPTLGQCGNKFQLIAYWQCS